MKVRKLIVLLVYALVFFLVVPIKATNAAGGVLSGYVMKSDGKTSLAGAIVRASHAAGTRIGSVTTSSDGRFIFIDLESGNYELAAYADGYNFSYKSNISVMSNKVTPDINFILFQSASISGKVTESDNSTPIVGAKIVMYDIEKMVKASAITDVSGNYEINNLFPGTYGLRAENSGYAFNVKWPIEVEEGQRINDINFILKIGASIGGKVLEQITEIPIEEAIVIPIESTGKVFGIHLTDSKGNYSINDLPDGDYVFSIRAENYSDLTEEVTITEGQIITDANFYLEPTE